MIIPVKIASCTCYKVSLSHLSVEAVEVSVVSLQKLHARYVLQLLGKTWTLLRLMPNISHVGTCRHKEITICGE